MPDLPGWTPEDAFVPWLLAHAADPRQANDTLQDQSSEPPLGPANATFEVVAGNGSEMTDLMPPLSGAIGRLTDDLIGAAWTAESAATLRWGLIRTR